MGFWGYWKAVVARAAREAVTSAWGGDGYAKAKALGTPFVSASVVALIAGTLSDSVINGLIAAAVTLALWPVAFFIYNLMTVPAQIHAEGQATIGALSANLEQARQSAVTASVAPDRSKIGSLMLLAADKCLRLRGKHQIDVSAQRLWARQLVDDINLIYGKDLAYFMFTRVHPQLLSPSCDQATMDGYMKTISGILGAYSDQAATALLSFETPDLNGYVDRRLRELRAEIGL